MYPDLKAGGGKHSFPDDKAGFSARSAGPGRESEMQLQRKRQDPRREQCRILGED